jgi:hypothetical protein
MLTIPPPIFPVRKRPVRSSRPLTVRPVFLSGHGLVNIPNEITSPALVDTTGVYHRQSIHNAFLYLHPRLWKMMRLIFATSMPEMN